MNTRPGRLYRKLKPTAPLFQLTTDLGSDIRDPLITGITIKRGDGSPGGGGSPSTLETGLAAFAAVQSGNHCELSLTTYGAQLLADRVGADAASIRPRFVGRIGKQTVEDRGRRQFVTMLASSWSAQLGRVRKSFTPVVGDNVATVISELVTSPVLPHLDPPTRIAPPGEFGTVHQEQDPQTYGDIGRWTSDLGIKVIETRSGGRQLTTHPARWAYALENMDYWLPVIRAQALAPASWEQASEGIARNQRLTWGSGNGTNSAVWGDVGNPNAVVVQHDLTHARFNDETQIRAEGYRLRALEWDGSYSIPSVEIDLLHLITSPRKYDRDQADRLLRLDEGDPVYLSGDWHHQLAGVHFATGITETINGHGWTLTLALAPAHVVVGSVSPAVPARVWASATYPWSDESRTWNAA